MLPAKYPILLVVVMLMLAGCWPPYFGSGPLNSPEYMKFHHGLEWEEYQDLLSLYGTTLDEVLALEGRGTFPVNYIGHRISQLPEPVVEEDISKLIKGYELKCESVRHVDTYFFYSTDLSKIERGSMPLIFYVIYEDNSELDSSKDTRVFRWISGVELVDSGAADVSYLARECGLPNP